MPGHFTLHEVGGKVLKGDEWKDIEDIRTIDDDTSFADLVDPVKIVYGVFFDGKGNGDVWVEFTLGHSDTIDEPIRIDSFYLGSNNDDIDIEIAETRYARNEDPDPYIWDEADSVEEAGIDLSDMASITGEFGQWRTMYEEHTEFDDNNRIFACNLGDERVLCTPVRYDSPRKIDASDDPDLASLWVIRNFRKLTQDQGTQTQDGVVLYPSEDIERKISSPSNVLDQDTITFWLKWKDTNLTIPNDDISFHFRFAFHSDIGDIKHSYPYYVLPPQASLMESLSEHPVDEFYPKKTHWMFLEWVKRYNVDRAGTGRMTRSKIKETDYVYNSGVFGFSTRSPKNMALRFIYAVLGGGILAKVVLSTQSVWQQGFSILGILILVLLVYLTFLPRMTPMLKVMAIVEDRLLSIWDDIPFRPFK